MSNTIIQIRRSVGTEAPTSLANGELAYSGNSHSEQLFVGNPNGGAVTSIGGKKYGFLQNAQTGNATHAVIEGGRLTANAVVITNANNFIDQIAVNKLVLGVDGTTANVTSISTDATISGSNNADTVLLTAAAIRSYISNTTSAGFTIVDDASSNTVVSGGDTIVLHGTANQVAVTVGSDAVTVALTSNVSISDTFSAQHVKAAQTISVGVSGPVINTTAIDTGDVVLNSSAIAVGTTVVVNTSGLALTNAAGISVGNSTVNTQIYAGNVHLNGSILTIGTGATNTTINATAISVHTVTVNTITATSLANIATANVTTLNVSGLSSVNNTNVTGTANVSVELNVGGNVNLSTSTLKIIGAGSTNTSVTAEGIVAPGADITGTANVGVLNVKGNTALGDATTDVVSFNARVNTSINPSSNVSYDLGTNDLAWREIHANNIHGQYMTIDKDVTISGDLFVNGNVVSVNVSSLAVEDSLIQLASNNTSTDTLDIGFFGNYNANGGAHEHTGLFRDASDGIYKLFQGLTVAPTTTIDTGDNSYTVATLQAYLNSGALVSNSSAVTITANSTVAVNITANTITLGSALTVNNGGTGRSTLTTGAVLYGDGTNNVGMAAIGSNGQVLQVVNNLPSFGGLDGGSF